MYHQRKRVRKTKWCKQTNYYQVLTLAELRLNSLIPGIHIHHLDHDKGNDTYENLALVSEYIHKCLHSNVQFASQYMADRLDNREIVDRLEALGVPIGRLDEGVELTYEVIPASYTYSPCQCSLCLPCNPSLLVSKALGYTTGSRKRS